MLQKNFSCCIFSATSDTWHCIPISAKSLCKARFSNSPCVLLPLKQILHRGHHVNVYVCIIIWVSVLLCSFACDFMCLCLALTDETAAEHFVSDWSPVVRSGELCELWCSLTAAFSWKASLWGPAGFQYAHLHIKTAQERDSAQGGWGTTEWGRAG